MGNINESHPFYRDGYAESQRNDADQCESCLLSTFSVTFIITDEGNGRRVNSYSDWNPSKKMNGRKIQTKIMTYIINVDHTQVHSELWSRATICWGSYIVVSL
jgi:hypothetical protein